MDWSDVLADPCLADLPYKVELNPEGRIEMSPASNLHAARQAALAALLHAHMGKGCVLTECSVQTREGVRVPDVAWASSDFIARLGFETPFSQAPELCIEIASPGTTLSALLRKREMYLDAGACEVWLVLENGNVRYWTADGEQPASRYGIQPLFGF